MTPPIKEFTGAYRFLSNFWPVPITFDGCLYASVEHAYQASKVPYDMRSHRLLIQHEPRPGRAKAIGKKLPLRPDWEKVKLSFMYGFLIQKFDDPGLRAKLQATQDAELVEGNYWGDSFWGVCEGIGENHLGKLLMRVRSETRLIKH